MQANFGLQMGAMAERAETLSLGLAKSKSAAVCHIILKSRAIACILTGFLQMSPLWKH